MLLSVREYAYTFSVHVLSMLPSKQEAPSSTDITIYISNLNFGNSLRYTLSDRT